MTTSIFVCIVLFKFSYISHNMHAKPISVTGQYGLGSHSDIYKECVFLFCALYTEPFSQARVFGALALCAGVWPLYAP